MIKTRNRIADLLKNNLIGCELGIFKGSFSEILIKSKKFKKLYLVDPFAGNIISGDKDGYNMETFSGDYLFNLVSNKFKNERNVEIKRECSVEFLKSFKSNYFDIVYIDSSHEYNHTKKELNEAYRVVKKEGGIISGHDYNEVSFSGVFNAVNEFAEEFKLKIKTTEQDKLASFFLYI